MQTVPCSPFLISLRSTRAKLHPKVRSQRAQSSKGGAEGFYLVNLGMFGRELRPSSHFSGPAGLTPVLGCVDAGHPLQPSHGSGSLGHARFRSTLYWFMGSRA